MAASTPKSAPSPPNNRVLAPIPPLGHVHDVLLDSVAALELHALEDDKLVVMKLPDDPTLDGKDEDDCAVEEGAEELESGREELEEPLEEDETTEVLLSFTEEELGATSEDERDALDDVKVVLGGAVEDV